MVREFAASISRALRLISRFAHWSLVVRLVLYFFFFFSFMSTHGNLWLMMNVVLILLKMSSDHDSTRYLRALSRWWIYASLFAVSESESRIDICTSELRGLQKMVAWGVCSEHLSAMIGCRLTSLRFLKRQNGPATAAPFPLPSVFSRILPMQQFAFLLYFLASAFFLGQSL